jgi:glutathione S-transferase
VVQCARGSALALDTRERAATGLDVIERELGRGPWLLGDEFT